MLPVLNVFTVWGKYKIARPPVTIGCLGVGFLYGVFLLLCPLAVREGGVSGAIVRRKEPAGATPRRRNAHLRGGIGGAARLLGGMLFSSEVG